MNEDIDEILANILAKEPLTDEEKQHLQIWSNISSKNEKTKKFIQALEQQKKVLDKHQKQETVFTRIKKQVYQKKKKRHIIYWSSFAASIILLIGIFLVFQQRMFHKEEFSPNQMYVAGLSLNQPSAELILPDGKKRLLSREKATVVIADSNREMRTDKQTLYVESNNLIPRESQHYTINIPLGAEYNIILPDGTKIYLNAGSSLKYPDQFIGEKREVSLTGEGYFEVASDSLHPFVVHVADMSVEVLGTSFNINAYPEEEWVKTTLVEGSVKTLCGNHNFIMKPNTQVAYNRKTQKVEYFPVNIQQYTSWKDGYYDFEDMPLKVLMQIFSRWYNIKLEFAKPELKELKFSGRLKRYDDLHSLFKMLEYTRDIKFIIGKDKIIIQSK